MVLFLFYDDMKVFSILYSPDLKKRTTVKQFKGPHECLNNTNIDNNPGKLAESLKEKRWTFFMMSLFSCRVFWMFSHQCCVQKMTRIFTRTQKREAQRIRLTLDGGCY